MVKCAGRKFNCRNKKVNPNFDKEYYILNAFYDDSSLYQILLTKAIPTEGGNVYLGIKYSVYIEDGVALELNYSDYPSHQMLKRKKQFPKGFKLLWRVEEKKSNCRIFRMHW